MKKVMVIGMMVLMLTAVQGFAFDFGPSATIKAVGSAINNGGEAVNLVLGGNQDTGDIKVSVSSGEVINYADDNSEAEVSYGTVSGVKDVGDVSLNGSTGDIVNYANGNSRAVTRIVTVGR